MATTALLSDIHGNEEALKVVLAAIDDLAVDQIICLGDSVDYGPRSQQVLSMLRERNIPSIKGNHDAASTGAMGWERFSTKNHESLALMQAQLTDEEKEYLNSQPETLDLGWGEAVHGSPYDILGHDVRDAESALQVFRLAPGRMYLVGHTHVPVAYAYSPRKPVKMTPGRVKVRDFSKPGTRRLVLDPMVRYILNPGSVGQPRDMDPRTAFAVVEHENDVAQAVTWYRLPYDWHLVKNQIIEAGLPSLYGERLLVGE